MLQLAPLTELVYEGDTSRFKHGLRLNLLHQSCRKRRLLTCGTPTLARPVHTLLSSLPRRRGTSTSVQQTTDVQQKMMVGGYASVNGTAFVYIV